jgi:hypothetical protein
MSLFDMPWWAWAISIVLGVGISPVGWVVIVLLSGGTKPVKQPGEWR